MNLHKTALALLLVVSATAAAEGGTKASLPPPNRAWQEECGSCHLAYPPRFLPAASWERVMAGLDKHFNTDASLEPAVAKEITTWLVANARKPKAGRTEAGGNGSGPPPLRITETRWFQGEHDELSPTRFRSPAVGSPANCGACHTTADQGNFSERNIKVPAK
jgi:cytochrome c553